MYSGVFSSIVACSSLCSPEILSSKKRFYSTHHCKLHIDPQSQRGLCSVPCKWKHVLSLSASRGCTWSSIPTPGGVHNHLRQKKVEFQTGAWLDLQWQTWTSYGPDTGPAQNRQEKALLALEVTQGLPPSTESNRHKQAGIWPECVKALWCLSFTFFKESQITHWNDSKAKKFYQNEPFSVNYSSNGCIRTLSSFFP